MKSPSAHSFWLTLIWLAAILASVFWSTHSGDAVTQSNGAETEESELRQPTFSKIKTATAQLNRARPEEQKTALTDLLAGKPFVLVADGRPQRFILSRSEFYAPKSAGNQKLRQIAPQASARDLITAAEKAAGHDAGWVLYPENQAGVKESRHVMKRRILIQTTDRQATLTAMKKLGLKLISEPDYAPGFIIAEPENGGPEAVLGALATLTMTMGITSAGPLLSRQHAKFLTPDDRYFSQQWHLKNTGQGGGLKGFDMKVSTAWDSYKGRGIKIGIVDDGLEISHPDLAPNVATGLHYDWNDDENDNDPTPRPEHDDTHGTAVAGVAAARGGNSIGVSGVAPEAELVGLRLISSQNSSSDEEDAQAMAHRNDLIHIKNCSWGSTSAFFTASPLLEAARRDGALNGRDGKGTLYVWAAGNERGYGQQGQKDGFTSSMYVNTVGALTHKGGLSAYSETGSHLIVSAPSSGSSQAIYSTDLLGKNGYNTKGTAQGEPSDLNYTDSFGGTSSATPAVAGMMALMLEANPNLNWRDVKEILLRSATRINPTSSGWISHPGGRPSLPPIKHHESYGGGAANAAAAVELAAKWDSLGSMIEESRSDSTSRMIPDDSDVGINVSFDFSAAPAMRVEHAKLLINLDHPFRGDLEITLRSPEGIVSKLVWETGSDGEPWIEDWILNSVRHWGESANGIWTLTIKDLGKQDLGEFRYATLTLYGTSAAETNIVSHSTGIRFLEDGQPLDLSVQALAGSGSIDYLWRKNGQQLTYTQAAISIPAANHSMGGTYTVTVSNINSTDTSGEMPVGIVKRTLPDLTINEGTTLTLPVSASGPGLSYQWRFNNTDLENGGKFSGVDSATLIITDMQTENAGAYTCLVSMEGVASTIETRPANISVRLRPVVIAPSDDNGVVSGLFSRQFSAENGVTKFKISKLPPGVTFNTTTGVLSGRPSKAGVYTLTITATNLAGDSEPYIYRWEIEDFPLAARGNWRATIQRTNLNSSLGGRFSLTISKTGTYSGKLILGAKSYSLSSRINAVPGNQASTTPFSISRGKSITPLTGTITLKLDDGTLTGSITDNSFSADLSGVRNPWTTATPAVPALMVFNTALERPDSVTDNPLFPQGNGYVIHKLSPTGTISSSGRLAEGTSFTFSSHMGPLGQLPVHALLYDKTGSIQGDSTIERASELVAGSLSWFKIQQSSKSTTRSYQSGIPLHSLHVRGSRYIKPSGMIIGLDTPLTTPPEDNAKVRFSGLPLNPFFEYTFPITAANSPQISTAFAANPQALKMKLDAKTGLFSGSFSISVPDPLDLTEPFAMLKRTPTYQGLLVTHPELMAGVGYFLLNELPDAPGEKLTNTPIQSGQMDLTRP
jgi:subtilisin family serine protease/subtilisin-like proprotein convertase family protein